MILAQSFALNLVTQALGWSLLHFMWQGTLIAAVLAVALHGLRRQGANVRYVACGVAMLLMAAAPAATFFGRAGLPTTWVAQAPVKHVHGTSGGLWSAPLRQDDPLAAAIPWLVAGWLAGVGLLLVRLAGGWILVQRFKRKAVRTALRESHGGWQETVERLKARLSMRGAVRVVESAATAVPTTIGWLRPVILMPAAVATGLTPQQLEVVIAHELAHIRRHDYLVNLLQCVVETLLFYHPGVWWVSGRMREEREYCCDDLAVAVCGNPVVYARTLTSLEALRADAPALSVSATGGSLMNRICRIVGLGPARPRRAAICLVPCGICGAIGVAAAAAAALFTASAEDARKLARQQVAPAEEVLEFADEAPPLWSLLLDPLLEAGQVEMADIPLAAFLLAPQASEPPTTPYLAEVPLLLHYVIRLAEGQGTEIEAGEHEEFVWEAAEPGEAQPVVDLLAPRTLWVAQVINLEDVQFPAEAISCEVQLELAPTVTREDVFFGEVAAEGANQTIELLATPKPPVVEGCAVFIDDSGERTVLQSADNVFIEAAAPGTLERTAVAKLVQGVLQCDPGPDCEVGPNCQSSPECDIPPGCEGPIRCEVRCVERGEACEQLAGELRLEVLMAPSRRYLTLMPVIRRQVNEQGETVVMLELVAEAEPVKADEPVSGPK